MKVMNIIDLSVQSVIIGLAAIGSLVMIFTGGIESVAIPAMYAGFFLGPWQLVGSLITTIARRPFIRLRVVHLIGSVLYLSIAPLLIWMFRGQEIGRTMDVVLWVFGFGVPLTLALFYYYITFKTFQSLR